MCFSFVPRRRTPAEDSDLIWVHLFVKSDRSGASKSVYLLYEASLLTLKPEWLRLSLDERRSIFRKYCIHVVAGDLTDVQFPIMPGVVNWQSEALGDYVDLGADIFITGA